VKIRNPETGLDTMLSNKQGHRPFITNRAATSRPVTTPELIEPTVYMNLGKNDSPEKLIEEKFKSKKFLLVLDDIWGKMIVQ
jgi:hypothetical protein